MPGLPLSQPATNRRESSWLAGFFWIFSSLCYVHLPKQYLHSPTTTNGQQNLHARCEVNTRKRRKVFVAVRFSAVREERKVLLSCDNLSWTLDNFGFMESKGNARDELYQVQTGMERTKNTMISYFYYFFFFSCLVFQLAISAAASVDIL